MNNSCRVYMTPSFIFDTQAAVEVTHVKNIRIYELQ